MKLFVALILLCVLVPAGLRAQNYPNYLSFGLGDFDFDKNRDDRKSLDYRFDYQWDLSLLPTLTKRLNAIDHYIQLHPVVGLEGNSNGSLFANSGLNLDIPFLRRGILTWGEGLGVYSHGDDPRSLGSPLEFRSQVDLGWRFDNDMRATAYISHISNAGLSSNNPGAEIVGLALHVPLTRLSK